MTNPFTQTTPQVGYPGSTIRPTPNGQYGDQTASSYEQQHYMASGGNQVGYPNTQSSSKKQDTSYTYTLQQPFHGQQHAPQTAAFGQMHQQYHETSSDEYTDEEGEEDEDETESSAIEEDYGEDDDDDDSQESSFTDYNPSDKVMNRYYNGQGGNGYENPPPYNNGYYHHQPPNEAQYRHQ